MLYKAALYSDHRMRECYVLLLGTLMYKYSIFSQTIVNNVHIQSDTPLCFLCYLKKINHRLPACVSGAVLVTGTARLPKYILGMLFQF